MNSVRTVIGGLGNLMFKNAFLWAKMRDGEIPDVYVQDEKYFSKYRQEIRQLYGQGIGHIDKVALHIRRGDYLKASQFHVNLWDTDYYQKAVKLFPNEHFLVFCKDNQGPLQDADDQAWCQENFPALLGENFEMYQHGEETDDLNAMASCKGIIMANSTFSWWAAYLGNQEKIICPKKWFSDDIQRCGLLDEWTLI